MSKGTIKKSLSFIATVAIFLLTFALNAKGAEEDCVAMTRLGIAYQNSGDRSGALHLFKNAIKADPNYPATHFFLGRLYYLMQKSDDAIAEFNIFREKMNTLQSADEEMKKDFLGKLSYISEVYFAMKKYTEAKEIIEASLKIDPRDQTANYNLGVYYYTYEHSRSKAYQSFKKVIDLDAATDLAKRAQYAIEFIRNNSDPRIAPDFSFVDKE